MKNWKEIEYLLLNNVKLSWETKNIHLHSIKAQLVDNISYRLPVHICAVMAERD